MLKSETLKANPGRGRDAAGNTGALGSHGKVDPAPGCSRSLVPNLAESRPLEAVKMFACKLSLQTSTSGPELLARMSDAKPAAPWLRNAAAPYAVVAAIDCRTRALLGIVLSRNPKPSTAISCLQMITRDKGAICNAPGGFSHWSQHGIPERIVVDSGPPFASPAFVAACQELGISIEHTIAGGHPAHDMIERRLQTTFDTLLSNISRDVTSSVLATALTADAPEPRRMGLVRRIAEIYHNRPQTNLGGRTPLEVWDDDRQSGNVPLRAAARIFPCGNEQKGHCNG